MNKEKVVFALTTQELTQKQLIDFLFYNEQGLNQLYGFSIGDRRVVFLSDIVYESMDVCKRVAFDSCMDKTILAIRYWQDQEMRWMLASFKD